MKPAGTINGLSLACRSVPAAPEPLWLQPPWTINPMYVAVNATVGAIAALIAAPLLAFLFRRLMRPVLQPAV